jgi:4-hydroxyphenylacetate 3-monooxygenase
MPGVDIAKSRWREEHYSKRAAAPAIAASLDPFGQTDKCRIAPHGGLTMPGDDHSFTAIGQIHGEPKYIAPLLGAIAAQAAEADRTRSVDSGVIRSIKNNDIMRMSASREIAGLEESIVAIANELRAIAPRCGSTAWCLWNHLCVLHHFAGILGPANAPLLAEIVAKREWVCFPAGASSEVTAVEDGGKTILSGVAAFGSGVRYSEWAGVAFVKEGVKVPQFTLVDLRHRKVSIRATWDGSALRASATDHIHYGGVDVPPERVVPAGAKYRALYRRRDYPMIHHRYREDWVGISVMWLGAMATGIAEASIDETAQNIRGRIAIFGTKMVEKPTIHVNLGRARALINAATDTVYAAMAETDARIAAGVVPTEGDYFRQTSAGMQAVMLCDDAMRLILRVLGGNGLREGTDFERRYRDFQAMPVHINGHVDRITEQLGRISLGLESQNPF